MTDKSAAAIREFAERWGFSQYKTDDGFLIDNDKTTQCISDLTALIEEHYVSKEIYVALENTLAKTEDALLEQRGIYFRLFNEETVCMYCETKIKRGSAIVLCKSCAEDNF